VTQVQGILHDATEAYLPDLAPQVKIAIPQFKALEQRLWKEICLRFGIPTEKPSIIKAGIRSAVTFGEKPISSQIFAARQYCTSTTSPSFSKALPRFTGLFRGNFRPQLRHLFILGQDVLKLSEILSFGRGGIVLFHVRLFFGHFRVVFFQSVDIDPPNFRATFLSDLHLGTEHGHLNNGDLLFNVAPPPPRKVP
jgi:hypothetical protein